MTERCVYIVDDDPAVRDALGLLLGVRGYQTAMFSNAEDCLAAWRPEWEGCLILDIRMTGMDGLALQKQLLDTGCELPVIVITGHGDVGLARDAFRARAVDFLEKPIDDAKLMAAIADAFDRDDALRAGRARRETSARLRSKLTAREREVMDLVLTGKHNRDIAPALGISVRTVEVHKARVMTKLGVDNMADLIRLGVADSQEP